MSNNYDAIVWSPQSENDLDDILEYYLEVSPEKAYQHLTEILDETERMVFSEQWQIDEFDPSCRRVIVKRKFKVLYQVLDNVIFLTRVYPTQKNPEIITK